jgi:hypothetical protein
MVDFSNPVEFSFVLTTVGAICIVIAIGIWLVKIKKV